MFVCSMGELFGEWVPKGWQTAVLQAVRKAPQWNFLFLTKCPERLVDIQWPPNAWVGTTVDTQGRVGPAVKAFKKIRATVRYLSCEPLLERLEFPTLACFDWVIIGARSGHGDESERQPEAGWVWSLMDQARRDGCKVYCKPNLLAAIREYPRPEVGS